MKKIVMGIAALSMAASIFAADFSATVKTAGDIASGKKGEVSFLKLNKVDQKDSDALIVSANGDKSGAQFQFWYTYENDANAVKVRGTNLWFKPMDSLKVKIGSNSEGTYKEMINWWKDPIGNSYSQSKSWNGKYAGFASVEGDGFNVDFTGIPGLTLSCGVNPGAGNAFTTLVKDKKSGTAAYGAYAKYGFGNIPVSAAISWRDAGAGTSKGTKVLAIGADYGSNWSDGIYAFLNARLNFGTLDGAEKVTLNGICFDNYTKFAAGAFKVMARVPVIVRFEDGDPSYLEYQVKATYAAGALTPYVDISSDHDNAGEIRVKNFKDDFIMIVKPGVTMNVGSVALNLAAKLNFATGADFTWSVPFEASMTF